MGNKKLNAESYAEARAQMMTVKGESHKSLNIVPDLLVVAPQNEAIARELLFADLIAGSTNVNKNTCDLLVVPELSDYADQWYLFCTKRYIKPFVFQEREKRSWYVRTRKMMTMFSLMMKLFMESKQDIMSDLVYGS